MAVPQVIIDIDRIVSDNSDQPANCVLEISGNSPDLMKGHGGSYVYLASKWGHDYMRAITSLSIDVTDNARNSGVDLAKGCGGNYIYLDEQRDQSSPYKICDIAIVRSGSEWTLEDVRARGFSGMTSDLCRGRGGDYVYIVWKVVQVI